MKCGWYVNGEVNYKDIAEKVFLLTDAKKRMAELGQKVPEKVSVAEVPQDSPNAAILRAGDTFVAVDGVPLTSALNGESGCAARSTRGNKKNSATAATGTSVQAPRAASRSSASNAVRSPPRKRATAFSSPGQSRLSPAGLTGTITAGILPR